MNNLSKEIIVGIINKFIDSHNDFCKCDYCKILVLYRSAKISESKAVKRMSNPHSIGYRYFSPLIFKSVDLKIKKDRIKEHYKNVVTKFIYD